MGTYWIPYPHPTGFLPAGTQVICARNKVVVIMKLFIPLSILTLFFGLRADGMGVIYMIIPHKNILNLYY
jgi:hypothetical protein